MINMGGGALQVAKTESGGAVLSSHRPARLPRLPDIRTERLNHRLRTPSFTACAPEHQLAWRPRPESRFGSSQSAFFHDLRHQTVK